MREDCMRCCGVGALRELLSMWLAYGAGLVGRGGGKGKHGVVGVGGITHR